MRSRLIHRPWWLCAVGAVLCLLAALFAFEAKLAWYNPPSTPFAEISATKLQPTDAGKLVAQVLAIPHTAQHFPAEASLLFTVAFFFAPVLQSFTRADHEAVISLIFPCFSPPLSRRPPPRF